MAKQQSSWRSGAGGEGRRGLLIPVTGSAVGVEGGDVEQNDGNGSGTQMCNTSQTVLSHTHVRVMVKGARH